MNKKLWITAVLFALTAVILGAMGAHALEKFLTIEQLKSFETGVRYQMYHAFAIAVLALIPFLNNKSKSIIYYLFTTGVILFSGSIYLLSTASVWQASLKFLGPITPIGGLLLITGWVVLLLKIISNKNVNH